MEKESYKGKMRDEPKKQKMMEIGDVTRLVRWQWT
jgi:hypothetical protein